MRRLAGVLAGAMLLAAPLIGQRLPGVRDTRGFWVGMGGGIGQFSLSCSGCQGLTRVGFAGNATIGYSLGRPLQVAVQFCGDRVADGSSTIKAGAVHAQALVSVPRSSGLFVGAGLGFAHFELRRSGAAPSLATVSGFDWQVGVGYEHPVAAGIALTPTVSYGRLGAHQAQIGGVPSTIQAGRETLSFSLSLDWHWDPIQWHGTATAH
ncbi:MAG: outer membrane beta-barrel protein [Gemmatimonadales bacterium]